MVKFLGLVAGSLFAYAAVPQAVRTIRAGRHLGTPPGLAAAIFLGTILMSIYLFAAHGFDWVIVVNYSIEALSWGVLLVFWAMGLWLQYGSKTVDQKSGRQSAPVHASLLQPSVLIRDQEKSPEIPSP